MAKYGKKAQSKVKRAMHERKHGTLKSGRSGKKVTSRKQAIAIGLSEAREGRRARCRASERPDPARNSRVFLKPPRAGPRNIVVLSSGSPTG